MASTDGRLGIGLMAMGAFVVAGIFRLCVGISDAAYLVVAGMALAALGMALIDPDERTSQASTLRRAPRPRERGWIQ
ncbi:hypothetical protein AKJ09_01080 [Labilithrix luteola]|uniref:Uncharacterized protein n=1 Tax=Labilithrix luteola TaxID=1391654 RepID=A0A0K1PLZ6_9BACT|nr:hypothetical protein AKJ09_01080 [Labilithrix luteola]